MVGAIGGWVVKLHRESMGPLLLDETMPLGGVRDLTDTELRIVWAMLPSDRRCPKEWQEGSEGNLALKKARLWRSPAPDKDDQAAKSEETT